MARLTVTLELEALWIGVVPTLLSDPDPPTAIST
jgi:hypothetical protein